MGVLEGCLLLKVIVQTRSNLFCTRIANAFAVENPLFLADIVVAELSCKSIDACKDGTMDGCEADGTIGECLSVEAMSDIGCRTVSFIMLFCFGRFSIRERLIIGVKILTDFIERNLPFDVLLSQIDQIFRRLLDVTFRRL